jgi:hypothetical protein
MEVPDWIACFFFFVYVCEIYITKKNYWNNHDDEYPCYVFVLSYKYD